MKYMKKIICVLLALCMIMPSCVWVAGAENASPVSLLYEDFESMQTGAIAGSSTTPIAGGNTYGYADGQYAVIEDEEAESKYLRMMQPSGTNAGYPLWRVFVNASAFADAQTIVSEYRVRVNISDTNSRVWMRSRSGGTYGTYMPYFYMGDIYANEDINRVTTPIGSYQKGDWVTVTNVHYINSERTGENAGKARRDIWINGEYASTVYDQIIAQANDYVDHSGNFYFNFSLSLDNAEDQWVDIDYVRVYAEPSTLTASVLNSERTEVKDMTVVMNHMPAAGDPSECFTIKDEKGQKVADVTGYTGVDRTNANKESGLWIKLKTDQPLMYDTSYILAINGLKDTVGNTLTTEIPFTTRPRKIYADQLSLSRNGSPLTTLSDGALEIDFKYVNEQDEAARPVILAVLLDENKRMTKVWAKELNIDAGAEGQTVSFSDINLTDTEGKTLKVFAVKSRSDFSPLSTEISCNKSGLTVGEKYDPIMTTLREPTAFSARVDGDTQMITVAAEAYTEAMKRRVTILVLKDGAKLENFDPEHPEDTILMADSGVLTAQGLQYRIPDVRGTYPTYLFMANGTSPREAYNMEYFGVAFMDDGRDIVYDITADEVDQFLKDYETALSIDLTAYRAFNDKEQEWITVSVEAIRKESEQQTFADFSAFFTALDQAMALCKMKTEAEVKSLIQSQLNHGAAYEIWNKQLSDSAVSAVINALISANPRTYAQLADTFEKQVVFNGIAMAESHSQVAEIITKLYDEIGLNLTNYQSLNSDKKKNVCLALAKKTFGSYSALVSAFNSAVNGQSTNIDSAYKPGGGGFGGGSSVKMETKTETQDKNDTQNPSVEEPQTNKFMDLDGYTWAKEAIYALYDAGVINGEGEGVYAPHDAITRAEFAKMVVKMYDLADKDTSMVFTDVHKDAWYYTYVMTAAAHGLIHGVAEGIFAPEDMITREMAAVILYRAAIEQGKKPAGRGATYGDEADISDWATEAVSSLSAVGVISGDENGNFHPISPLNRAEAAQLMYNMVKWEGIVL